MKIVELILAALGIFEKIWGAFSKTPSEKITKAKVKLRDKIDKMKKTGRPKW